MKYLILTPWILFALILAGCTDSEVLPSGNETELNENRFTLTGYFSSSETRTSIGEKTGNVYPVLWAEGDAIGLFSNTNGVEIKNIQASLSEESVGQNSGIFTTSERVNAAESGNTKILIYS